MIKQLLLYFLGFSPFLLFLIFGLFIILQDRKREKLEEEEKLKSAKLH